MQKPSLTFTLLQTNIIWGDRVSNLSIYKDKIASLTTLPDIVVLPELFNVGFNIDSKLAEPMEGPTIKWMLEICSYYHIDLVGSILNKENGNVYNRLIWMKTNGSFEWYDKRHLFCLGDEHKHLQPGNKRLVVDYKGWKICPVICYDLRFPVWCRNRQDYDVLLVIANWPDTRQYAWNHLLIARAIENQAYVIGLNRVGEDGNGLSYVGGSFIVDPMGIIENQEVRSTEKIIHATLSMDVLRETRSQFPCLRDADVFNLSS